MNITRRDALKKTAILGAAATIAPGLLRAAASAATGEFKLMLLPYGFDALEPAIDTQTMQIHYGKHHAGYVRKLNAALTEVSGSPSLEELMSGLADVPEPVRLSVRNNGGGTYNHNLFWQSMAPPSEGGGGAPAGALAARIRRDFGSVEAFQQAFSAAAGSVFGSGWAWLILRERDGKLAVVTTANQDNPRMTSVLEPDNCGRPLLGLDVWEHAYYLHYQNRRADYISNWWKVVNWQQVAQRLG
ncbi:MAG: superoxide dismutase [Kiritimatiellia bacterium]